MSLARLFLSGLMIAGGLILGAFTLHGYLDPDWAQRRMMAAGARPSEPPATAKTSEPPVMDTFTGRNRFVARHGDQASPSKTAAKSPQPPSVQADVKPPAKPAAKKKVADKNDKAEKPDKAKRPQQASAGWPWNLFSN